MNQFLYSEDDIPRLKALKERAALEENWNRPRAGEQRGTISDADLDKHTLRVRTIFISDKDQRALGELKIIYTVDYMPEEASLLSKGEGPFHHLSISVRLDDFDEGRHFPVHTTIIEHFAMLLDLPPAVFIGNRRDLDKATHYIARVEQKAEAGLHGFLS
jgi:hypothetical protein